MASSIFDYIQELYVNNLYHDVVQTMRFNITTVDQIKEMFGINEGIKVLFFFASSLYHTKEFKLSLQMFQNCLAYYSDHYGTFQGNSCASQKRKNGKNDIYDTSLSFCTPSEIKYQMHLCFRELGELLSAINILKAIPKEFTNLKTLNALSELYIETNNPREGLNCLINVVMVNPLALFSLRKILNYASSSVVENFVQMVCKRINEQHLPIESTAFTSLVQAFHLARLPINFKSSYQTFFNLRSTQIFNSDYKRQLLNNPVNDEGNIYQSQRISPNSDNLYMMLEAAKYLYYDGFVTNATIFFKIIYSLIPELIEGLDCYAACLYRETKFKHLQKLTSHVLALCSANDSCHQINTAYTEDKMPNLIDFLFNNLMNTRPEPWIVIGYYNLSKKQTRTIFFANKALQIDPTSEEAMVLKTLIYSKKIGYSLNLLKSHREFIEEIEQFNFKTKYRKLYIRFEIIKYLAEAILVHDGREMAENYVKEAIDRYGMTPRICTFYSNLIFMDQTAVLADQKTAVKFLEDAVRINPLYLSAVDKLSKMYIENGQYEKAIPLLLKTTEKFNYQFIHKMIVDCYNKIGERENALIYQNLHCIKTPMDTAATAVRKIKEEYLRDSLDEMDMKSIFSINPVVASMEAHENVLSFDDFEEDMRSINMNSSDIAMHLN